MEGRPRISTNKKKRDLFCKPEKIPLKKAKIPLEYQEFLFWVFWGYFLGVPAFFVPEGIVSHCLPEFWVWPSLVSVVGDGILKR